MIKVYISVLSEEVEVSDEGKFALPSREYTPAELKKIAREVNRAMRNTSFDE